MRKPSCCRFAKIRAFAGNRVSALVAGVISDWAHFLGAYGAGLHSRTFGSVRRTH